MKVLFFFLRIFSLVLCHRKRWVFHVIYFYNSLSFIPLVRNEAKAQKRLITHSFASLNVMRETMKFILYVCSFLFANLTVQFSFVVSMWLFVNEMKHSRWEWSLYDRWWACKGVWFSLIKSDIWFNFYGFSKKL